MNIPRLLQRLSSWPCVVALCLLIFVGTLCVKLCPRTVPLQQCSELYQRYAQTPGIDASFIKDFRVNDSVTVDVTLLEARDSAGWATLKHDFAVHDLNDEWQQYIDNGEDLIFSRKIAKNGQPLKAHDDTANYDMLAISYYSHTLTIFHITNNDEKHAVYCHNFDESINPK